MDPETASGSRRPTAGSNQPTCSPAEGQRANAANVPKGMYRRYGGGTFGPARRKVERGGMEMLVLEPNATEVGLPSQGNRDGGCGTFGRDSLLAGGMTSAFSGRATRVARREDRTDPHVM